MTTDGASNGPERRAERWRLMMRPAISLFVVLAMVAVIVAMKVFGLNIGAGCAGISPLVCCFWPVMFMKSQQVVDSARSFV